MRTFNNIALRKIHILVIDLNFYHNTALKIVRRHYISSLPQTTQSPQPLYCVMACEKLIKDDPKITPIIFEISWQLSTSMSTIEYLRSLEMLVYSLKCKNANYVCYDTIPSVNHYNDVIWALLNGESPEARVYVKPFSLMIQNKI